MNEEIYTITFAAKLLECSERYLRDAISKKKLKGYKKGKRLYILKSDLIEWIKSE